MSRHVALVLCCLAFGACAAPTEEQMIQTALDAGKAARDAERAACLVVLSKPTKDKEPGLDEYCRTILACRAP